VVNTGNGENEVKMEKNNPQDTEESATSSAPNDAQPMTNDPKNSRKREKDELPLTPTDALTMLASALNQCRKAGIRLGKGQQGNDLILSIRGAQIASNGNGEIHIMPVMAMEK
jgi:hypothetical protein